MKDRFETRVIQKKAAAIAKESKEDSKGKKNELKSSKFFSRLQDVAKDDAKRKEEKRKARAEGGKHQQEKHSNESTKRFKL